MISINASRVPVGKLPPEPWITAPETLAVLDALSAKGTEVRFVGGCVRDSMAHQPVTDIDIGTPDPPETVIELLEDAAIKAVPTGIDHGTVTAVIGEEKFEITTLRRDVETDGRRATVAYTNDWVEDSNRRDFTINALSATPDGDVYDPHDGITDLAHGKIRFVGLAGERIEEDVLRLLRFFRFYGHFGRPPPDPDAMAACRIHADKLPSLSAERVRDELLKIMMTPDPAEVGVLMRGLGIFDHILPEAGDVGRLRSLSWLETRAIVMDAVYPDALRRLAALLDNGGDAGDVAATVAGRLKLSNRDKERLGLLARPPLEIQGASSFYTQPHALPFVRGAYPHLLALGLVPQGMVHRSYYITRQTDMVVYLVEGAFLSHPEDEMFLQKDENLKRLGEAVLQGLEDTLRELAE